MQLEPMPDDQDPLNEIVDQVANGLTLSTDPIKSIVKATAKSYIKTVIAGTTKGAVVTALVVSGAGAGEASLSQEQARKPDEHIASGSQHADVTLEDVLESLSSTGGSAPMPVSGGLSFSSELIRPIHPHSVVLASDQAAKASTIDDRQSQNKGI